MNVEAEATRAALECLREVAEGNTATNVDRIRAAEAILRYAGRDTGEWLEKIHDLLDDVCQNRAQFHVSGR